MTTLRKKTHMVPVKHKSALTHTSAHYLLRRIKPHTNNIPLPLTLPLPSDLVFVVAPRAVVLLVLLVVLHNQIKAATVG